MELSEKIYFTMSEKLNEVVDRLEKLGLVYFEGRNGKYVTRGNRNLKINGENIKAYFGRGGIAKKKWIGT